jgi:hypothetical protein
LDSTFSSTEEADLSAIQLGKDWVSQQQASIDKLQLTPKIISWKELLETQVSEEDKPFSEYLLKLEEDYKTDKVFRNHIDTISKKYAEKLADKYNPEGNKFLKAARDYLLEESTIIFKLVHRGFTSLLYPGNGNAALRYVHRKYFGETNPMPWLRYDIQYPRQEKKAALKESASSFFQASSASNTLKIKKHIKKLFAELTELERLNLLQDLNQGITKTEEVSYENA